MIRESRLSTLETRPTQDLDNWSNADFTAPEMKTRLFFSVPVMCILSSNKSNQKVESCKSIQGLIPKFCK